MKNSSSFLGYTLHFSEAFPKIKDIDITWTQDSGEFYLADWQRVGRLGLRNICPQISCGNPRCKRGGFDLESRLQIMVSSNRTEESWALGCDGDEGSPQGMRRGQECMNNFKVTARISYKNEAAS